MPATEEYIRELVEDRRREYDTLHKQIRENRALRSMTNPINIPDNYQATTQVVHTPVIPDILLRVVSTLTTDPPSISCPPAGQTAKAQKNSSLKERHAMAAYDRMSSEIGRDVFRMGIDGACADGLRVWKLIHRADAWSSEPRRKRTRIKETGEDGQETTREEMQDADEYNMSVEDYRKSAPFPILWNDIDALTYLPLHDGTTLQEVVEVTRRPLLPTLKALGVRRLPGGTFEPARTGAPYPTQEGSYGAQDIECWEHWDETHQTFTIDGKLAKQTKHKYGRPPYFEIAGHTTSSREPARAYLSVIEPFKHLVPALDRLLTIWTNLIYIYGWPFLIEDPNVLGGSLLPEGAESVAQIEPGRILRGVKYMEPPGVNKDLIQFSQLLTQMIDRAGLASVMYGAGASTSSGYMVSQLMTAAQLVYKPILSNAKMAGEQMTKHFWQIVEKTIRQPVYVYGNGESQGLRDWLAVGPDDINGYYANEWSIKPLLPMDEIARGDAGMRWAGSGGISRRYWREEMLGIAAPEEMDEEIAVERFMDRPDVAKQIQDRAYKKAFPEEAPQQPPPGIMGPMPGPNGPPGGGIPNPLGGLPGTGMGEIQGPAPMVPGVNMPLVPPEPVGAGLPPQGPPGPPMRPPFVPRRPGGNRPNPAREI